MSALATSGQRASLAMEDAVTLTQCLRDLPDTERAFVESCRFRCPSFD
jgi:2-polyprenyl-6-methoxyphenol hydroxylase-like FAD-dependent oxidoreductase